MQLLFPVWFFLSAIFFYLAYAHWRLGKQSLRMFRTRPPAGAGRRTRGAAGVSQPLDEFATDFNKYLEAINEQMRGQNLAAASGYFIAGLLALISMVMVAGAILPG
jgi:hypothetical protein